MSVEKKITPEQKEVEDLDRFRDFALRYYRVYLDKRDILLTVSESNLFAICAPFMARIIRTESNNAKDLTKIDHRPIFAKVTKFVRLYLRYYKKQFHPLKNILLLRYLYARKVHRITSQGRYFRAAVNKTKVQEGALNGEYKDFYALFEQVKNNTTLLTKLFHETQNNRYKKQGKSKAERRELCAKKIEQLRTQTSLDIVQDKMELYEGITDIFIHTRRNVSKKGPYDAAGDPYGIWIGEHFMRKIMQIPDEEQRECLFGRVLLEGSVRFDTDNDQALPRDEAFWQDIVSMVNEGEPIMPLSPEEVAERKEWERLEGLFRKALELTADNTITGMNITRLAFLFDCMPQMRKVLRAALQENPDISDTDLIWCLWPVWLTRADQVIQEVIFENHEIKNIWRNYLVWTGGIRRFTPDGRILVPHKDGPPSHELTSSHPEYKIWAPMRDFIQSASKDKQLLNKVFDKYLLHKYEAMKIADKEKKKLIAKARADLIGQFMTNTNIDIMAPKDNAFDLANCAWVTPHTSSEAHFRGNHSKKHESNYDGHPYGVWMSEIYVRTLMDLQRGKELFVLLGLEEQDHMRPGGHIPFGTTWETVEDYQNGVWHTRYTSGILTLPARILDELHKLMPHIDLQKELRKPYEERHPYLKIYRDVMRAFFDGTEKQESILYRVTHYAMSDEEIKQVVIDTITPIQNIVFKEYDRRDEQTLKKWGTYVNRVLASWIDGAMRALQKMCVKDTEYSESFLASA